MSLLPIIGWRIWYGDGTVADSRRVSWADAPVEGVQVIAMYHEGGRKTLTSGLDTYAMPGEYWEKAGAWIDDEAFDAMYAAAFGSTWL